MMPKNVYPKSHKRDIDDAVLHSEYDNKLKKVREKEEYASKVNEVRIAVIQLRDYIIEKDPILEQKLDFFRECQKFIKKLESC